MARRKWFPAEEEYLAGLDPTLTEAEAAAAMSDHFGYQFEASSVGSKRVKLRQKTVDEAGEDRKELHYRQQIAILTRKNKELMGALNIQEALINATQEHIEALPKVKSPPSPRKVASITEEVLCLDNSDFHIGEIVKADEMGGLNAYNFDIYAKRLQLMSDAVASFKTKMTGYNLRKLHVNCLGDMLTGIIHDELVQTAEDSIVESVFNGALVYAQFLAEMLTLFESVELTGVIGNHGRMTKKVTYKQRYVNWDYFFYQTVALMLAGNPRITFDLPRSFWTVKEIGGRRILLMHGDNIRSWQGIPWYGIKRSVANLNELLDGSQGFDDVHLAHFHDDGSLARVRGKIMLNGSVIGGTEFSIGALFSSSEPTQTLYAINPHHKRMTWWSTPYLAEERNIAKCRYHWAKSLVVADQVRELIG